MAIFDFQEIKINKMRKSSVKKACGIVDKAFLYLLKTIKEGESEKDLAFRIDKFIKKEDAKVAFPTIVAAGSHSYFIHHKPCRKKIRKKEPILLDFGAKVDNFCSDLSRTVFIGDINSEFKSIYNLVLKAQKSAILKIKDGICANKLDLLSRKIISKSGFGNDFKHTLGHGLGDKVHQSPSISPGSKDILKAQDIITIEPGIYLQGKGGVRIEDDILVTKDGYKILTKSGKELEDIIIK